jgi:hypothetical protein
MKGVFQKKNCFHYKGKVYSKTKKWFFLLMENIKTVLSSSIAAVFFVIFVVAGTMWYNSTTPIELFGPTHYQWVRGYF